MYRFAFNGKEKTDEWNGEGNSYDYGFRIYDPRIGKFLSVDPLAGKFPYYTPYQFAGNKPIWALDLDGLEDVVYWVTLNRNGTCAFIKETGYDILGKGVQHGTYVHVTRTGGNLKDETYQYYVAPSEPGNTNKGKNQGPEGYAIWGNSSNDNGMSERGQTSNGRGGIDEMVTPGGGAQRNGTLSKVVDATKNFVEWIVRAIKSTEEKASYARART